MNKKWIIIGISIVLFIGILAWLFMASNKPAGPLPGEKIDDLGRDHVTDISQVNFNSNPPTSGSHFPVWAKRGVYDRVLSDGHLIHSLEHGYIILSYNCDKKISNFKFQISNLVYAHEGEPVEIHNVATSSAQPLIQMKVGLSGEMSAFTPQNPPEKEVELPENFNSDSCKDLVSKLSSFLDKYQRIVIVPRPNLDSRIALTAWTRLEKFDNFDEVKMKEFIESYHNKGPERTME